MYWMGNIAKSRIIGEILDAHPATPFTIFDYGCGDGGDWKRVLADRTDIRMVGYEPDRASANRARERAARIAGEIYTGDAIQTLELSADCIVTFSVFEHVVDRREFLAHAKRLLAPNGMLYLNYDDGHFRTDSISPTSARGGRRYAPWREPWCPARPLNGPPRQVPAPCRCP